MASYAHLGGHLHMTHTDRGSLKWMKKFFDPKVTPRFLDVGCSIGGQVLMALDEGFDAYGVEGDYSLLQERRLLVSDRIYFTDLTKTHLLFPVTFDVVWCVEVAEHIEEKYLPNLMKTITYSMSPKGVLVFTANEGPGINHVNRKPMSWWKRELEENYGLTCDEERTTELRNKSTMTREFVRSTGFVFIKQR